jgi:hypothetical protein
VERLRTALTDFDEFMARRYQGAKGKGEGEGRDRFEDLVRGMDKVELGNQRESEV